MIETLIQFGNTSYPVEEAALEGLVKIYQDLSADLKSNSFPCLSCGDCCNFKEYDHELRLTHLELYFLISKNGLRRPSKEGICPYLENQICGARTGRALGCRIFFCGADAAHQEQLYEQYLGRIRNLIEGEDVYFGELLASLRSVKF